MASTPSASALSAVLRCKRPPASAYRLGLTCGAVPSVSRAEKSEEPERRSSPWGIIWPEARAAFPGVTSVSVRMGSVKLRGLKRQITHLDNHSTEKDPVLCKTASCISSESGRRVTHESGRRITEDPSDSDCGLGKISGCFRLTDTLSVKLTSPSERKVLCVGCMKNHRVSSAISHHRSVFLLKTTLLQLTAFVLSKLGAVWKKSPVDDNQLPVCVKCASVHGKDKAKKGLDPGT